VLRTHPRGVVVSALVFAVCVIAPATTQAVTVREAPRGYSNGKELEVGAQHKQIIAWGTIELLSSALGEINCVNTFFAEGWNAHENVESKKPIRGYGEVLGWGNSECQAPTEIHALEVTHEKEIKEGKIETPITVTATAEMPLEKLGKQAEICINETKSLEQCSAKNGSGEYTEREVKLLTSEYHRRVTSLPWKVELIKGEREGEVGAMQKIGINQYGESGTASAKTTKCYPTENGRDAKFTAVPTGCVAVNIVFPQIPSEFVFYGTQEIFGVNGVKNGLSPSRLEFIESGGLFSTEGLEGEGTTTGTVALDGAVGEELLTAH